MEVLDRLFEDIVDSIEVQDDNEQASKSISNSDIIHQDIDEDANPYNIAIPFNVTKLENKNLVNYVGSTVRHFFESLRIVDSFFIRFRYNRQDVLDVIDRDLYDDFYDISDSSDDNSYQYCEISVYFSIDTQRESMETIVSFILNFIYVIYKCHLTTVGWGGQFPTFSIGHLYVSMNIFSVCLDMKFFDDMRVPNDNFGFLQNVLAYFDFEDFRDLRRIVYEFKYKKEIYNLYKDGRLCVRGRVVADDGSLNRYIIVYSKSPDCLCRRFISLLNALQIIKKRAPKSVHVEVRCCSEDLLRGWFNARHNVNRYCAEAYGTYSRFMAGDHEHWLDEEVMNRMTGGMFQEVIGDSLEKLCDYVEDKLNRQDETDKDFSRDFYNK